MDQEHRKNGVLRVGARLVELKMERAAVLELKKWKGSLESMVTGASRRPPDGEIEREEGQNQLPRSFLSMNPWRQTSRIRDKGAKGPTTQQTDKYHGDRRRLS